MKMISNGFLRKLDRGELKEHMFLIKQDLKYTSETPVVSFKKKMLSFMQYLLKDKLKDLSFQELKQERLELKRMEEHPEILKYVEYLMYNPNSKSREWQALYNKWRKT